MPDVVNLIVSAEGLTALADMALAEMALAEMALAPRNQSRLDGLMARNVDGTLSEDESQELDLSVEKGR